MLKKYWQQSIIKYWYCNKAITIEKLWKYLSYV